MVGMLTIMLSGVTGCGSLLGSGTYNKAWTPQEKCRAVHLWVTKFWSELPPKPPDGTKSILGYYENLSINLFKDEYFVPMFGSPFDQMSDKDRQVLGNDVGKCFTIVGRYKDWQDLNRYYGAVMPHWQGEGRDFARHARDTKQWHSRELAELRSAPPSEETLKIFLHAKAHSKRAMEQFLPAEQKVFNEALEREGRPVAEAVLIARIDKASAVASTYEGVKQLQEVVDDEQGLFDLVSQAVKAREEARAAQAYKVGFTKLLEEEWKRFEARGTKVTAVKKGVLWYQNLQDRYIVPFDFGPPVESVLKRFREAREKDLAESATFIIEDLKANATTVEELSRKQQDYLVSEDALISTAKPIHAWIEHQKAVLNFQNEKWRFSENELALMKTPGIVTVPSSYDSPSGDDIRMALLRAYVRAGGRLVDKDTATVPTASVGDLLGTFGTGGLPRMSVGNVSIGSVRVEDCSEGKGSALVGNYGRSKGYLCRYTAKGQVNSDEFMLTSQGWLSPTADNRVEDSRNRMTLKFMEDVGSAVPKVGCRDRRGVLNWWCR
jgi:hypothetical protein